MADGTRVARQFTVHSRTWIQPYRSLIRLPGAAGFFFPAAVARLGIAMTGLGLLWTVRGLTGSFAVAGITTGAFALAEAIAGPPLARVIDRHGQTRVVPFLLGIHAAAIAGVIVAAGYSVTSMIVGGAVVAGASIPQVGALSAARWTHLVPERERLQSAFSLEAIMNDLAFLSGPPIVTLASSLAAPYTDTLLALGLLGGGSASLAMHRETAPPVSGTASITAAVSSSLLSGPFVSVIGVTVGLGCFFGAVPVIVTAYSAGNGFGGAAGILLAVTSIASLASGVAYGAMRGRQRPRTVQLTGAIVLAAATGLMAAWLTLPTLLVGLFIAGAITTPLNVSCAQLVESAVEPRNLTLGFVWINTASASGIATASTITGLLIETHGIRIAFLAGCGLTLLSPLSATIGIGAHNRPPQRPGP